MCLQRATLARAATILQAAGSTQPFRSGWAAPSGSKSPKTAIGGLDRPGGLTKCGACALLQLRSVADAG